MVFWLSLRRLAFIIHVFIRHALAHAVGACLRRCWPWLALRLNAGRLGGPERLRVMLEHIGGTFIKFGQMLALQPDIISLEYCNALFNLLDRVTPFSSAEVERIFVEEFGARPSEMFESFEVEPLATASIGQVHIGRLGGRKLAVKVQRPNVQIDFAGDIRLMAATIRIIKTLRLRFVYWMVEPMSEFLTWTHEELDYRYEARYMERLRRNARDNAHERIPEVLWQFTTRRTLVSEFFEGETLLAYLRALETDNEPVYEHLRAMNFEPDRMARHIIDNFLGDVFRHGMFHADLHPANLIILPGNTVGYIDFGITGTISQYSRQNLVALTLAYTRGDLEGMCEAFFRISVLESETSAARFREGLKIFSETWYEPVGKERRLRKNFTLVMLDMLRLSRRTGVWPERDVVKYIRSAIAIDGLITRFAPTFDLGRHLQAVCDSHLRWSARREMFTYDSILDWAISGERIARDGPLRAGNFVERLTAGELEAQASLVREGGDADDALRRRAVQLGAVVFTVALAMSVTGERLQIGINLLTAELLLIGAAGAQLLRTIRRLA
ncbi:MAG TPA: AarF/UbiB family protein [Pyrinomonadaceae bacterium]|jgi:predicted unusual protein kinase regulating ubiquinone biosynthesis (AarF/ABC1/UbiB family)